MEGLDQFDREKDRFIHYPHDPENPASLAGNRVHAIAEDKKAMLWIGTQDGGLSKFDRHTGQFPHYQHNLDNTNSLSQQDVIAIFEDYQM
jgi:ligand-binding sensor domain-containing protein